MSMKWVSITVGALTLAAAAPSARAAGADSSGAAVTAGADADSEHAASGDSAATAATGGEAKAAGLSGTWRLDRKKSTMPDPGMRPGGSRMGGGPGGWGGGPRRGGPGEGMRVGRGGPGGGGGFFGRLPDLMSIDEVRGLMTLSDSTGKALQEIVTSPGDSSLPAERTGVRRIGARRDGNRVEIERPAPMGGTIFETYALKGEDVLEIHVKIQPEGDMPPREFVRVYNREHSP